jgi:hypothetical protein
MIKYLFLTILLLNGFNPNMAVAQPAATQNYTAKKFSIDYPASWKMTNEKGILNFFPEANNGAVTVSAYSDIEASDEKMKELLVSMYEGKPQPDAIKKRQEGSATIISYEFTDNDIKWIAKAIRNKTDLFLLTINCVADKWEAEKQGYINVMESFKIK